MFEDNHMKLKEVQRLLIRRMMAEEGKTMSTRRKNVPTKIWGASAWKFLESVVQGYPKEAGAHDRMMMIDFLTSLGSALPCQKCRLDYKKFISKYPPTEYVATRSMVRKWLKAYKSNINKQQ